MLSLLDKHISRGRGIYGYIYIYGVSFKAASVFSNEKLGKEFDTHTPEPRGGDLCGLVFRNILLLERTVFWCVVYMVMNTSTDPKGAAG